MNDAGQLHTVGQLRFGSLFAGIGGLDLGLERAGMRCAWQVEVNPWARRVLAKHWPDVPRWGDITEVDPYELPAVDLICGGFPCQPHSLAGKRKASEDDRDLWGEFARIIRGARPRWVLAENVPGLLSSRVAGHRGGFFGQVLRDLAELGFDARWASVPAAAFGAPHLRWRVFVVAHARGEQGRQPALGTERQDSLLVGGDGIARPLADADSCRREAGRQLRPGRRQPDVGGRGEDLADPHGERCGQQHLAAIPSGAGQPGRQRDALAGDWGRPGACNWWDVEPGVGRVAHGVPGRLDRLGGLGNAVVPQVAEFFGHIIARAAAT